MGGLRHCWKPCSSLGRIQPPCRYWSSSQYQLSGHSRWSKIKHDKAKKDASKGSARSQASADIVMASKLHGPDPKMNPRLAHAILEAKRGQLSKTAIEHAIAKGQGKLPDGRTLENVVIEAMLPHGVAAMIECETDSKARTLTAIRHIISKAGGNITPTSFLFEKKGRAYFGKEPAIGIEDAMEGAIEAGALDIEMEGDQLVVETEPSNLMAVAQKLQIKLKIQLEKAEVVFVPNEDSLVALEGDEEVEVRRVIDTLEEEVTVQGLYVNAA